MNTVLNFENILEGIVVKWQDIFTSKKNPGEREEGFTLANRSSLNTVQCKCRCDCESGGLKTLLLSGTKVQGRGYSGVWGSVTPPQASSLSAKLLRIKVLSAIFRKSILSQEDDS